jgi:hypothetical protein
MILEIMAEEGGSSGFTRAQIDALRAALRAWVEVQPSRPSQAAVGDAIGVSQQVASNLLGTAKAGLKYDTATKIAILAGYPGVDAFFEAQGIAGWDVDKSDMIPNRRNAVPLARRLGATEDAVRKVREREGPGLEERTTRWWVEEMLRETDEEERRDRERRATFRADKRAPKRRSNVA